MASRTGSCACGRVTITVETEPSVVTICHCDFCQKRTGSVFNVAAGFGADEPFEVSGETRAYNGAELDDAPADSGRSITFHFCPTCGSTVYWMVDGSWRGIPVGVFVDRDFPAPTIEAHTSDRHHWVPEVPGAEQHPGPYG